MTLYKREKSITSKRDDHFLSETIKKVKSIVNYCYNCNTSSGCG